MKARSLGWLLLAPILVGGLAMMLHRSESPGQHRPDAPAAAATEGYTEISRRPPSDDFAQHELPSVPQANAAPPQNAKPILSSPPPIVPGVRLTRAAPPTPEARQRAESRATQASALDARLERRIADLRSRRDQASGAEREAMTADLALLERNLASRRAWEQDAPGEAARPAGERGR